MLDPGLVALQVGARWGKPERGQQQGVRHQVLGVGCSPRAASSAAATRFSGSWKSALRYRSALRYGWCRRRKAPAAREVFKGHFDLHPGAFRSVVGAGCKRVSRVGWRNSPGAREAPLQRAGEGREPAAPRHPRCFSIPRLFPPVGGRCNRQLKASEPKAYLNLLLLLEICILRYLNIVNIGPVFTSLG